MFEGAEERGYASTRSKGYQRKTEDPLKGYTLNAWRGGLNRARNFRQRMADIGECLYAQLPGFASLARAAYVRCRSQ